MTNNNDYNRFLDSRFESGGYGDQRGGDFPPDSWFSLPNRAEFEERHPYFKNNTWIAMAELAYSSNNSKSSTSSNNNTNYNNNGNIISPDNR